MSHKLVPLLLLTTGVVARHSQLHQRPHRDVAAVDLLGSTCPPISTTTTIEQQPIYYSEFFPYNTIVDVFRDGGLYTVTQAPVALIVNSKLTRVIVNTRSDVMPASRSSSSRQSMPSGSSSSSSSSSSESQSTVTNTPTPTPPISSSSSSLAQTSELLSSATPSSTASIARTTSGAASSSILATSSFSSSVSTTTSEVPPVVTTTLTGDDLAIGQGLPSNAEPMSDLPPDLFLLLAFTDISTTSSSVLTTQLPRKIMQPRQDEQTTASPITFADLSSPTGSAGSPGQDSCDLGTPVLLRQGSLVRFNTSVGKVRSDTNAVLGTLLSPPANQVNTTFAITNGILSWVAPDVGPASFFNCAGDLFAAFGDDVSPDCRPVIVGAIAGARCSQRVESTRPVVATFTAPIETAAVQSTATTSTSVFTSSITSSDSTTTTSGSSTSSSSSVTTSGIPTSSQTPISSTLPATTAPLSSTSTSSSTSGIRSTSAPAILSSSTSASSPSTTASTSTPSVSSTTSVLETTALLTTSSSSSTRISTSSVVYSNSSTTSTSSSSAVSASNGTTSSSSTGFSTTVAANTTGTTLSGTSTASPTTAFVFTNTSSSTRSANSVSPTTTLSVTNTTTMIVSSTTTLINTTGQSTTISSSSSRSSTAFFTNSSSTEITTSITRSTSSSSTTSNAVPTTSPVTSTTSTSRSSSSISTTSTTSISSSARTTTAVATTSTAAVCLTNLPANCLSMSGLLGPIVFPQLTSCETTLTTASALTPQAAVCINTASSNILLADGNTVLACLNNAGILCSATTTSSASSTTRTTTSTSSTAGTTTTAAAICNLPLSICPNASPITANTIATVQCPLGIGLLCTTNQLQSLIPQLLQSNPNIRSILLGNNQVAGLAITSQAVQAFALSGQLTSSCTQLQQVNFLLSDATCPIAGTTTSTTTGRTSTTTTAAATTTPTAAAVCLANLPSSCSGLSGTNGLALIIPAQSCATALDLVSALNQQSANCLASSSIGLTTTGSSIITCLNNAGILCSATTTTSSSSTRTTTAAITTTTTTSTTRTTTTSTPSPTPPVPTCLVSLPANCNNLQNFNGLALLPQAPLCQLDLNNAGLTGSAAAAASACLNSSQISIFTQGIAVRQCVQNAVLCPT